MVIGTLLSRLRRRERWFGVAWGFARLVAVISAVLAICCYVDWRIDMRRDTPFALRVAMLIGQIALAVSLFVVWVMKPLVRRRSDDDLALFVEEQTPVLAHRLISAVQLNRKTAKTAGMSPVLIAEVTGEAEEHARRIDVRELSDERRLWKAGGVVAAAALFAGSAWLAAPKNVSALLTRQRLIDAEIPRSVRVHNKDSGVWPVGETVQLRLFVLADHNPPMDATVVVSSADGSIQNFMARQLTGIFDSSTFVSEYMTEIPGSIGDFTFEAWLGDGRLKTPGNVRRVPRPAIVKQDAWLVLPAHCGTKQNGERYHVEQPRGEIVALPGSSAIVGCKTQKPIREARLEMLGVDATKPGAVVVLRTVPMEIQADETSEVVGQFELKPDELAYRIVVVDEHGFENTDPPRRGIKIVPEEAPTVTLLPEQFLPEHFALVGAGTADDFEVEGVPIPLGGAIRIAYRAAHTYGLGKATFWYRVNESDWRPFPLGEVAATTQSGSFDLRRGVFANSRSGDQVQFHAIPSRDPERYLPRTEGGGRFDFQTRPLPELKIGDRIEYYVEVTNREPGDPKAGRSETRLKTVVTVPQLVQWIDSTLRQEDRIRQLEQKQKGVFSPR